MNECVVCRGILIERQETVSVTPGGNYITKSLGWCCQDCGIQYAAQPDYVRVAENFDNMKHADIDGFMHLFNTLPDKRRD